MMTVNSWCCSTKEQQSCQGVANLNMGTDKVHDMAIAADREDNNNNGGDQP